MDPEGGWQGLKWGWDLRGLKGAESPSKDGPGPVMVIDTLFPAVHILGTSNVHSRAKGTADHYWPWAVFF